MKKYKITGSCIGCRNCLRSCPVGAISRGPLRIEPEKCTSCGICYQKCPSKKIIEYEAD
ncbi:MAG: 4Fe-4S dicluster domain-containing protein [Lachnospiraceae bacterium]|nr:4Fe-4S dicluster domain-containing protein [Lachnospiraceae bacterium]